MTMTTTQAIITIAAVVLGTMATRFIPFIIFPEGKNPPEFVKYLGTVLPYAAIGLLVIYCLKDVPASSTHGLSEAIAIVFIVLLHKWKKSTLLSIGGGTVLYMVLVQTVFRWISLPKQKNSVPIEHSVSGRYRVLYLLSNLIDRFYRFVVLIFYFCV